MPPLATLPTKLSLFSADLIISCPKRALKSAFLAPFLSTNGVEKKDSKRPHHLFARLQLLKMPLQNLSIEIKKCIILAVENRDDLLHLALTWREFYNMIIATYDIHFTHISCSLEKSQFWQNLSASHHLCSMARRLEVCNDHDFFSPSWLRARSVTDERFIKKWSGPSTTPTTISDFEYALRCISHMDQLKEVFIYVPLIREEYNALLANLSKNLRDRLKTLEILIERWIDPSPQESSMPHRLVRYQFILHVILTNANQEYSFRLLTSFALAITHDSPIETTKLVLDSLVLDCTTLINFAITSDMSTPIQYQLLLKEATWPSLERLTLKGSVQLFDDETPAQKKINLAVSFFSRHRSLSCLSLVSLPDTIEAYVINGETPISSIFPSLRSLCSDFPIGPDLLGRLTHLSSSHECSIDDFAPASSLRSCILSVPYASIFEKFVESVPQLERLYLGYGFTCELNGFDCTVGCECGLDGIPSLVAKLRNLTHLELFMGEAGEEVVNDLFLRMADDLPRLTFCRVWSDGLEEQEWHRINRNENGQRVGEPIPLGYGEKESFSSESWGNFYTGPQRKIRRDY